MATLTNWKVLDDPWDSNHFPIEIFINVNTHLNNKIDYRYNFNKMDKDLFLSNLKKLKDQFSSLNFLNENCLVRYDIFVNHLHSCIEDSMPVKSKNHNNINNKAKNKKKRNCIWWKYYL